MNALLNVVVVMEAVGDVQAQVLTSGKTLFVKEQWGISAEKAQSVKEALT